MPVEELKSESTKLRYQEAMEFVGGGIRSGSYAPGEKLPGMKELSRQLGMNFLTVRKAMVKLAEQGLVEIRHGAGTFVGNRSSVRKAKAVRLGIAFRTYMLQAGKHHPVVGAFLAGVHQRCKPPGFLLQPLFYDEFRFVEEVGQTILDEGLSGVIIVGAGTTEDDNEFLRNHRIHVVTCSNVHREDGWTITVRHDKAAALRQAVEHLRSFGHKRIAFVTFSGKEKGDTTNRDFARLVFNHRLGNPDELMVFVEGRDNETHWEDVEKLFKISPLPTAVIVSDEFLADFVLDGCVRHGIKVPGQLSIVALQDAKPDGHRVPLTAVSGSEEITQMAYMATDLLVKRIAGHAVESNEVIISPKLVIKASSGPIMSIY